MFWRQLLCSLRPHLFHPWLVREIKRDLKSEEGLKHGQTFVCKHLKKAKGMGTANEKIDRRWRTENRGGESKTKWRS